MTDWEPGTVNWGLLFTRRHRPFDKLRTGSEHGRRMNSDEHGPRPIQLRSEPALSMGEWGKLFGRN
jgi:hypothetical protein